MSATGLRATITSAPVAAFLIALNVAVFVAVNIDGRLLDVLALPSTWSGVAERPWTLLTVSVTAEVVVHIAVAVLVIGVIGVRLERHAGSVPVMVVYLAAGLAGSLALVATAAATGLDEPSVGASAAFLGLLGALVVSPREAWGRLALDKIVVVVVVIQLGPAVGVGDWTSSAAHLAGLAVGAACGHLFRRRTTGERAVSVPSR